MHCVALSMKMRSRFIEGVAILELSGQFVASETHRVNVWLAQAASVVPSKVVMNLKGVDFLDTEALGSLICGLKRCRQSGGDLRLCHLQVPVRAIFEITGLDLALEVFEHEEDAVQMPWLMK